MLPRVLKQINRASSVVADRAKFLSPVYRTFEAYNEPLILKRANMQYRRARDKLDTFGQKSKVLNLQKSKKNRKPSCTFTTSTIKSTST